MIASDIPAHREVVGYLPPDRALLVAPDCAPAYLGRAVELAARADGAGGVVIEVSDSGTGVPPEALPHIFDRWARADGARTRERGGAGLGLAIVAAVARAHGGRCSVRPLLRGTAFRLHLPVRAASVNAPSPTPAVEGEVAGAGPKLALS